ncbi:MAG TPA: DUF1648 domain-containing protein [Candidatus Acidoferrum sp.]
MNTSRLPALVYFLLLALALLQWANAYPQLPETMASHFAADGTPNGWQPKQVFFLLVSIIIAVTSIPTFFLTRKISKRSPDRINLPNKEYWLAPEHQEETWRFISTFMGWFGCGVLFVLLYGISQAINFNLPNIRYFDTTGMLYVLGGFLLFVLLGLFYFVRHFYDLPYSSMGRDS